MRAPLDYERSAGDSKSRPMLATAYGTVVGLVAFAVWAFTFSPHGGIELSAFLFPISAFVLEHAYPSQPKPALLWFGGAIFQWALIGAAIDVARAIARRRKSRR
ncbi:MAG: hypothetical protein JWL69_1353 [Phycisphaerales bacterium]|nr:hypothetical protein [Phycisphaerales bacterium]